MKLPDERIQRVLSLHAEDSWQGDLERLKRGIGPACSKHVDHEWL